MLGEDLMVLVRTFITLVRALCFNIVQLAFKICPNIMNICLLDQHHCDVLLDEYVD